MAGKGDAASYSVVLATVGYADMVESYVKVQEFLIADGYENLAAILRTAFGRFEEDLKRVARDVAKVAHAAVVEEEQGTRVRPDTGGDGGRRLEDFVGVSAPLDAVPGSVGVNFEPALYDNVPWWWTNEEGYSGHVGRVVHGLFYAQGFTSASSPNISLSREHPLFRAEGPQRDTNSYGPDHDFQSPLKGGKGERPGMRIENPIPARRFVEKGALRAEATWHRDIQVAKGKFNRSLERVLRLIVPSPEPKKGRRP
jgi:hypothetical protein